MYMNRAGLFSWFNISETLLLLSFVKADLLIRLSEAVRSLRKDFMAADFLSGFHLILSFSFK